MNYFEFYDLPVKFNIDAGQLKKRFLLKSKATHPDYFTLASEAEQEEAMQEAVLNNQAYKVLADKNLRTQYILQIFNVISDGKKQQLPPMFLMEMMELNEAVMEANGDEELTQKMRRTIEQLKSDLDAEEQPILTAFDESGNIELLSSVRTVFFKRKYLNRMLNS